MTPGEVLFWPQKQHDDGAQSDKLLIVLCDQRNGQQLLVYTTSQQRAGMPTAEGCRGSWFVIRENTHGFKKNTWVQLWRVNEYEVEKLEDSIVRGRMKALQNVLPAAFVRAIVNCYRQSDEYQPFHNFFLS